MKPLRLAFFSILTLMTSTAIGQDIKSRVAAYNKASHVDSSEMLIAEYIEKYIDEKKWDSLALVLNLEVAQASRSQSMQYQLDLINQHEIIILDKLGIEHPRYLQWKYFKSIILTNAGDYTAAMEGYNYVIEKDKIIQSKAKYGVEAKVSKSFLLVYTDRVQEGADLALEALEEFDENIDTFTRIQVYQVLGTTSNYFHDTENALKYGLSGLELVEQKFGKIHPNVGMAYDQLGSIYKEIGDFDQAIEYQNISKSIQYEYYQKTKMGRFFSNTLANTALTYSGIGEYQIASENILQAIAIEESANEPTAINLLWYYEVAIEILIKDEKYHEAQKWVDLALNIVNNNAEATEYDRYFVMSYQAEIFSQTNQLDKALDQALQVEKYLQSAEAQSPKDMLHIVSVITAIYNEQSRLAEAEKWANKGLELATNYYTVQHSEYLNAIQKIMEVNYNAGKSQENIEIYQEVLQSRNNGNSQIALKNCVPDKFLLEIALYQSKELFRLVNSNKKGKQDFFDFLADFEAYYELHLSTLRSTSRVKDEAKVLKEIYHPAIELSKSIKPEDVIIYSEKIKSFLTRLILKSQLIQEKNDPFKNVINTELIEETEDSTYLNAFIKAGEIIEQFKEYKDSLYRNDLNLYRKKYGIKDIELEDLRNTLSENEMMIEFFKYNETLYTIYVDQKEVIIKESLFPEIESQITAHLESRSEKSAKKLYNQIIDDEITRQFDKLLILPDDRLYFLNFEELITPRNTFLVEEKRIRYAYSASILGQQKQLTKQNRSDQNVLGFTPGFSQQLKDTYISKSKDDLIDSSWLYYIQQPFLVNLASSISDIHNSRSFVSQDATEANFKSQSSKYKILHLGTHGILNDESPLFSKLIFAKDSIEDGYLHTYEIYGQNFNADLAVLSACNSGNGKLADGEGVLSLAHAFTHAGCPSILMTLWEVDEKSTVNILSKFYQNLEKGDYKSEALRRAKLDYLKEVPEELKDPYYWAGLVVIGSDQPLFETNYPWYLYVLLALILGFLFWYFTKKNRS